MALLTAERPLALAEVISAPKSVAGAVAWTVEATEGISVTEARTPAAAATAIEAEKAIAEQRAAET